MDDPYAILGVKPGVPADELAAAYRSQAKRWHPDRNPDEESVRRMAQVNAAYDLLRTGGESPAPSARPRASASSGRAAWLSDAVRRALGAELLEALEPGEEVRWVTPTATWASARAVLVVTDRRLLWLLDDDDGRRFAFAELRPPTAEAIVRHVRAAI